MPLGHRAHKVQRRCRVEPDVPRSSGSSPYRSASPIRSLVPGAAYSGHWSPAYVFLLLDRCHQMGGSWANMVDNDIDWVGDLCASREVETDMVNVINRGFGEVLAFIKARPASWKAFLKRARRRYALRAQRDRLESLEKKRRRSRWIRRPLHATMFATSAVFRRCRQPHSTTTCG